MKDKELRDTVQALKNYVDYDIAYKIKYLENKLEYDDIYQEGTSLSGGPIPEKILTLKGHFKKLEEIVKEIKSNQKLIIDYLGIEKIEEPPKSYYQKKVHESKNSKS
jgi:hypothetical protein